MAADFDFRPVLKGQLVELRPLRPADFDNLFAVASDPRIWAQHPVRDRYKRKPFEAFFDEALGCGGTLVVTEVRTGALIGSSRFHGHDPQAGEVEIGWTFLARSHWGGRYNGELKQLMLEHAFRFVRRVVLLVAPDNLRSQRAVEKIGGVRIGSRPDGTGRDSVAYAITESPRGTPANAER